MKAAYILFDEHDAGVFRDTYGDAVVDEGVFFPFDFLSMQQFILEEPKESYRLPRLTAEEGCSEITGHLYEDSQRFLKRILMDAGLVTSQEMSFPLEYFWFCLWVAQYRIVAFSKEVLERQPFEKVVLIKREKYFNYGGILIDQFSFVRLAVKFFENQGIVVEVIEDTQAGGGIPETLFYNRDKGWKKRLLNFLLAVRWKLLSVNRQSHNYFLAKPCYDNVIFFYKNFKASVKNIVPQIFRGNQMPLLHSCKGMLRFLLKNPFKDTLSQNEEGLNISSYKVAVHGFEYDFTDVFGITIKRYLRDVRWMKKSSDQFWGDAVKNEPCSGIFSLSPAHLDTYFLIKKIKESGGKIAVWQHGGFYGYTDHFLQYITDYKHADYFLSFGKGNAQDIKGPDGDPGAVNVVVGTEAIYNTKSSKSRGARKPQGLFLPVVVGALYSQGRVKWRADLQFQAMKEIIDYFGSTESGSILVKGFKNHKPHRALEAYITGKGYGGIGYTERPFLKVLSDDFKFVILDNPSTPLLQTLANYTGAVFLMVNQESWAIREDALKLLKRRVVFSSSVDALKMQLTQFLRTGDLEGVDVNDTSFIDTYVRPFGYSDYERFLKENILTGVQKS